MNRAHLISFVLAGALLVGGCVTRTPERDRSYISIATAPYDREGCNTVRNRDQAASWYSAMTRDLLPDRISVLPFGSYAYGSQAPLPHRPSAYHPLCLTMLREKNTYNKMTELFIALELVAVDEQTVRLVATQARITSSALWKLQYRRVNLALQVGLVDDSGQAPELISSGTIDLGALHLGQSWRAPWPEHPDQNQRAVSMTWPSDRPRVRLVVVAAESRHGRARPNQTTFDLQVAANARSTVDWYPAR